MSPYSAVVVNLPSRRDVFRYLGTKQWFATLAARLAPLDTRVFRASGGRFGLLGRYELPQLLLTTTGRKSGQPRTVTLLYGRFDGALVLIGSNFGQANHPAQAGPFLFVGLNVVRLLPQNIVGAANQAGVEHQQPLLQSLPGLWSAYDWVNEHAFIGIKADELKATIGSDVLILLADGLAASFDLDDTRFAGQPFCPGKIVPVSVQSVE